jgi:hypothetical protein
MRAHGSAFMQGLRMAESHTLTPFERQLYRGLLMLAGGGIVVLFFYGELVGAVCVEFVSVWTRKSMPALAAGKMPALAPIEILFACLSCGLLGAIFLISQYLAYLLGCGRLLRLTTLWLWTILFGVLNALLAASVLPFVVAPGFGLVLMANAGVCVYFGSKAWRARRKANQAAQLPQDAVRSAS